MTGQPTIELERDKFILFHATAHSWQEMKELKIRGSKYAQEGLELLMALHLVRTSPTFQLQNAGKPMHSGKYLGKVVFLQVHYAQRQLMIKSRHEKCAQARSFLRGPLGKHFWETPVLLEAPRNQTILKMQGLPKQEKLTNAIDWCTTKDFLLVSNGRGNYVGGCTPKTLWSTCECGDKKTADAQISLPSPQLLKQKKKKGESLASLEAEWASFKRNRDLVRNWNDLNLSNCLFEYVTFSKRFAGLEGPALFQRHLSLRSPWTWYLKYTQK